MSGQAGNTDDRGWFQAVNEPTQTMPTVPRQPPPVVVARAVIVYQEKPRRPWRLWAFTAVLVALTIGVVLGQTVAFEPTYRSTANAQTPTPADVIQSLPASAAAWPDDAHRLSAPLGTIKTRTLEVSGTSAVLHVRSADLGDKLFDVATIDRSAVPRLEDSKAGAKVELIKTGEAGTVGAEIQLNAKVAWTLKLTGGTSEQNVDMQAGGAAAITLAGGTAHAVLQLPPPTGTVRLSVAGPIGELSVRRKTGTPIRVKLAGGAQAATVDGKARGEVKPGTLSSTDYKTAKNRYDVSVTGKVSAVLTETF
ncbi:hypothetical protein BJ973_003849 [Actinoplanes tereljensis]|uniref:Uncharacterized protein n=1 Tax=Paractinoplanes tereljensis TaxID=571912 RepID=A0A919NX59_9ACTN|nr:hypothetical protein [Actinoplanes tereljensis]GIF25571.1 hypothetical protein Ate02nite_83010 [Actinoplanes tereljensis]